MTFRAAPIWAEENREAAWPTWGPAARSAFSDTSTALALNLYDGSGQPYWVASPLKGAAGERVLSSLMLKDGGASRSRWVEITPHRSGGRGIDALFVRTDDQGRLHGLRAGEAKFGASRLGKTRDGLQMSNRWLRPRFASTARDYGRLGRELRNGSLRASFAPPPAEANAIAVPLRYRGHALVWREGDRLRMFSGGRRVTRQELVEQTNRTRGLLSRASRGHVAVGKRLLHLDAVGREHRLTYIRLDAGGRPVGTPHRLKGEWEALSPQTRLRLRQAYASELARLPGSKGHVDRLTREVCENPAVLDRLARSPRWNWRIGLDRGAVRLGLLGVASAGALELAGQVLRGGPFDGSRLARTAGLGGLAGAVGYVGSQHAQAILSTTRFGNSLARIAPVRMLGAGRVVGGAAGGAVATLVMAYGSYALGLSDQRTANAAAASGLAGMAAGAAFEVGIVSMAATVGTASTGAAISGLSGAAASSATMAWIGGAVGGGAAAGAAVVTGGAALVGIAVAEGIAVYMRHLDEENRRTLIREQMRIVRASLTSTPA